MPLTSCLQEAWEEAMVLKGKTHSIMKLITCMCPLSVCADLCVDLVKLGLPKILHYRMDTAFDIASIYQVCCEPYIPWLVPNTCGFLWCHVVEYSLQLGKYSLSCEFETASNQNHFQATLTRPHLQLISSPDPPEKENESLVFWLTFLVTWGGIAPLSESSNQILECIIICACAWHKRSYFELKWR